MSRTTAAAAATTRQQHRRHGSNTNDTAATVWQNAGKWRRSSGRGGRTVRGAGRPTTQGGGAKAVRAVRSVGVRQRWTSAATFSGFCFSY